LKILQHSQLQHYWIINKGQVFSLFGKRGELVYVYPETDLDKAKVAQNYRQLSDKEVKKVMSALVKVNPSAMAFLENPPTAKN